MTENDLKAHVRTCAAVGLLLMLSILAAFVVGAWRAVLS